MKRYVLPDGYSFLRSIDRTFKQIKNPIGAMEESMAAYHGTYRVHLGRRRFIVTQDPAFIEHVLKKNHRNYFKSDIQTDALGRFLGSGLLTSNGDFWLRQRRLIQPGFHLEKIRGLYEIMQRTVLKFLSALEPGEVDVYPLMNRLAFDIVMNTLFNVAIPETLRVELGRFIADTQDFVMRDLRHPHLSWWFRLSGELKENHLKARRAREIIAGIVQERRPSVGIHGDLLDMLLQARYEDTGEPMREEQLIDEILVLIIAGHETTANALSWILFLLANNPAERSTLRARTKDLGLLDTTTDAYLRAVINEGLRLYPPAYISDRVALNDDTFNGYTFPAGTIIILFYYGLHRDSRHWSEPERFLPARFLGTSPREQGNVFFPFGSGPRLCIGNNFAMAEMAIFLQPFIGQFDVRPTPYIPVVKALVTLKPDRVPLKIVRL
jgi:cytochrome P450